MKIINSKTEGEKNSVSMMVIRIKIRTNSMNTCMKESLLWNAISKTFSFRLSVAEDLFFF
jgi:hypothetical protein